MLPAKLEVKSQVNAGVFIGIAGVIVVTLLSQAPALYAVKILEVVGVCSEIALLRRINWSLLGRFITLFLYRVNDRSLDVTLSFRKFLGLTRITKCHYCGGHIRWSVYATKGTSFGYNLDRKDNTRGYHIDNVVVCCGRCNRVKGDNLTYDEMLLLSPALQEITRRRGIMGHGRVRDKNKLKKQFMQPLRD